MDNIVIHTTNHHIRTDSWRAPWIQLEQLKSSRKWAVKTPKNLSCLTISMFSLIIASACSNQNKEVEDDRPQDGSAIYLSVLSPRFLKDRSISMPKWSDMNSTLLQEQSFIQHKPGDKFHLPASGESVSNPKIISNKLKLHLFGS